MMKIVVSLLSALCVPSAFAQFSEPQLRLDVPEALTRPIWIVSGQDGPADFVFQAYNIGGGELDLAASGGLTPWLAAEVEAQAACPFDSDETCRPVRIVLATADLEPGEYAGEISVSAPGAIDAPQTVPVAIHVGGDIPASIELFVPPVPGASDFVDFQTPLGDAPILGAAGDFLSVSSNNLGSFRVLHEHRVIGRYQEGLSAGPNSGSISIEGSSFEADNRMVPATLNVTSDPIGQLSADSINWATAQNVAVADFPLAVMNRGQGELEISGAATETTSGGDWLSAENAGDGVVTVRADVQGLAPGRYEGTVEVSGNTANAPHRVPVTLLVAEQGAPTAFFRGAVNGATFESTRALTPGAIASIFGAQLAYETAIAVELPLARQMAGTEVFVDGVAAPLFFTSYNQVNFQVPFETEAGDRLVEVFRDGQPGNEISIEIQDRSIGLFRFGLQEYGAIRNATQGNFPLPVEFTREGFPTAPARPGDVLEIFATGLGPVDPVVASGEPAPASPLSNVVGNAFVRFGFGPLQPIRSPIFVGLTPGFVGLFQINIAVPDNASSNLRTPLILTFADGSRASNVVEIAVER